MSETSGSLVNKRYQLSAEETAELQQSFAAREKANAALEELLERHYERLGIDPLTTQPRVLPWVGQIIVTRPRET